jgi:tRNA nucleotidyltransferase (CCA-adding enzyme)
MSDYNFLMESRLSPAQFQVINYLSRLAYSEGVNLYLVGGAVRDLTGGLQEIKDLDFAVEGDPQRILRHFEKARPKHTSPTAIPPAPSQADVEVEYFQFDRRTNSCEISFVPRVRAEIARCRRETYLRPNHPPRIEPGTIFDDLRRRDFGVNAMAVSLHPNSRGLLLDPVNGAGDIERRELRALHSRSFSDDPSRIFRIIRLGMRLGSKPEEKTQRWLSAAIEDRLWAEISPEAQGRELAAILREENPPRILRALADRGYLAGLERKLKRIPYDQFHKVRALAQKLPGTDPFLLNFHCLVSKLGAGQKKRLAAKIIRQPELVRMALRMEHDAKVLARQLSSSKASSPSRVFKLLSEMPQPLLLFVLAHYPQAKVQSRLKHFLFKAPQIRARLPRAELAALGMKPGPKFEKVIERVFFDQLDAKIRTPQQLTKALRTLGGIKEPPKPPEKHEKAVPKVEKPAAKVEKPPVKEPKAAPKPHPAPEAPAKPAIHKPVKKELKKSRKPKNKKHNR